MQGNAVRSRNIFYAVTMIYWFSLYMYVPILGPYVEHIGGSLRMVGWVVGSYGISQMLLRIPLGIVSDRIRRRKVFISIGMALAFTSSVGMGLVSEPWLVFGFRAMSGVAAATWVTFTVLFSSYFRPEEAPKAMGVIMFFTTLSQMIATTLGGFAAELFGWVAPFAIGGAVGAIGLILSFQIEERRDVSGKSVQVSELLSVGKERLLLSVAVLAILFQWLMFSTVYGFTPSYAVTIGASKSQLSILALVSSLPAALAALRSGQLVDRYGERKLLIGAFLLFAFTVGVIPFSTRLWLLYLTQAIGGLGRGVIFPVLLGLSIRSIAGPKRATAMGFFQSIYAWGMFAGPVLVGIIGDAFSLTGSFLFVAGIGLIAAALTSGLLNSQRVMLEAPENAM